MVAFRRATLRPNFLGNGLSLGAQLGGERYLNRWLGCTPEVADRGQIIGNGVVDRDPRVFHTTAGCRLRLW